MVNSTQGLLKALFHMAWDDGIVSPEEVEVLAMILRRLGFSLPEVISILDTNLAEPPKDQEPVPLEKLFASREEQKSALQALMMVCFSTGSIAPGQVGYIEGLVRRMGLSAQELEALRKRAMEASSC